MKNNTIQNFKFSDGTKMCRKIDSFDEAKSLQEDLQWSVKWQMLFNNDKFSVVCV